MYRKEMRNLAGIFHKWFRSSVSVQSIVGNSYYYSTMEHLYKSSTGAGGSLDSDGNTSTTTTGPNREIDIDKIAKIYTETVVRPSVIRGRIDEDPSSGCLSIYTEWSLDDVSKKDTTKFARTFTVVPGTGAANSKDQLVVIPSAPIPFDAKLTVFSKTGSKKAVLVPNPKAKGNGDAVAAELLQIFNRDGLFKTYDLKELDLHKGVYAHPFWGRTMSFSPDETKLIYLAEKKLPKASPFFSSYSKFNLEMTPDKAAEADKGKGQEFEFQQSWGEQLSKFVQSVIVLLDLETDKFRILELPDNLQPADLQWVGNESIVGTAYTEDAWKLGIIFCSNRESRIFQLGIGSGSAENESQAAVLDKEAEFRFLSDPKIGAICPRIRPDFKYLVWLERELTPQHRSVFRLMGSSISEPVPQILFPLSHVPTPPQTSQLPLLYQELPANCWSANGQDFYVITQAGISNTLLKFCLDPKQTKLLGPPVVEPNINGVLWVGSDYMLAAVGNTLTPNFPVLLDRNDMKQYPLMQVDQQAQLGTFKRLIVPGSVSPDSFYYGPTTASTDSVPLIVNAHGGPHGVFTDTFEPVIAYFLSLGFGILRVNYIGSTGASPKDMTSELLGKAGQADVEDCQLILQNLLELEPAINSTQIVYFGGSHGGFLGAHLSSTYPDTYKAVVLRNPVTDLLSLVASSDIADWCYAEAGLPYDPKSPSLISPSIQDSALALKLIQCSPIRNVDKVKGSTLLLLGTEDLRVPYSQGQNYYRALLAAGKTAEIRLYPDNHGIGKTEHSLDLAVHTVTWFLNSFKRL